MSSRIFSAPEDRDWKQAYMAAVLETDCSRLPGLAQTAIERLLERLHELKVLGAFPCEEIEAINDATYLLEAWLRSLSHRDENGEWTRSPDDN